MIKKKMFLAGLFVCFSIVCMAQRAAYISIDGNTVPIDNLLMHDSIVAGKINYTSSFTMPVNNDPYAQYILNALQKGNANVSIYYTRTAASTTERQYRNINMLQLQVARLDASGRNSLKIEVKLQSLQVKEKVNASLAYKNSGAKQLLNSNFLVTLDNLPSSNISSVSGLELKNNVLISFEIAARDIDAWSQALNTPGKKFNGNIFLLAPNMRDKVKQFKLSGIEMVSLTQNIITGDERIERFMVVARVSIVSLEDAK